VPRSIGLREVKDFSFRVIKGESGSLTELERVRGILTELVVILSELSVADGAILVDDATDLNNSRHARGVATELDDLDLTV
jgi:hypothetical protein